MVNSVRYSVLGDVGIDCLFGAGRMKKAGVLGSHLVENALARSVPRVKVGPDFEGRDESG